MTEIFTDPFWQGSYDRSLTIDQKIEGLRSLLATQSADLQQKAILIGKNSAFIGDTNTKVDEQKVSLSNLSSQLNSLVERINTNAQALADLGTSSNKNVSDIANQVAGFAGSLSSANRAANDALATANQVRNATNPELIQSFINRVDALESSIRPQAKAAFSEVWEPAKKELINTINTISDTATSASVSALNTKALLDTLRTETFDKLAKATQEFTGLFRTAAGMVKTESTAREGCFLKLDLTLKSLSKTLDNAVSELKERISKDEGVVEEQKRELTQKIDDSVTALNKTISDLKNVVESKNTEQDGEIETNRKNILDIGERVIKVEEVAKNANEAAQRALDQTNDVIRTSQQARADAQSALDATKNAIGKADDALKAASTYDSRITATETQGKNLETALTNLAQQVADDESAAAQDQKTLQSQINDLKNKAPSSSTFIISDADHVKQNVDANRQSTIVAYGATDTARFVDMRGSNNSFTLIVSGSNPLGVTYIASGQTAQFTNLPVGTVWTFAPTNSPNGVFYTPSQNKLGA